MQARADILRRLADSTPARTLEPIYARLAEALEESGLAERLRAEDLLGHSAHPVLTDLPIGLWTATSVLDLLGGRKSHRASGILCSLGVLTAAPTALTGLADLSRLEGEQRRLGVVHAVGNAVAVMFYAESSGRRLRGHHLRGAAAALLGGAAMTAAGYVGGELAHGKESDVSGGSSPAADGATNGAAANGATDGAGPDGMTQVPLGTARPDHPTTTTGGRTHG